MGILYTIYTWKVAASKWHHDQQNVQLDFGNFHFEKETFMGDSGIII